MNCVIKIKSTIDILNPSEAIKGLKMTKKQSTFLFLIAAHKRRNCWLKLWWGFAIDGQLRAPQLVLDKE